MQVGRGLVLQIVALVMKQPIVAFVEDRRAM